MGIRKTLLPLLTLVLVALPWTIQAGTHGARLRLLIVSSYHREYLWSRDTSAGVSAGLLEGGWLDNEAQATRFGRDDHIESSRAEVRKLWMDTKRANSRTQIADAVANVVAEIERFRPDLVMLGDDNATNYVGNLYLDTRLPLVFWGVNGHPTKYSIVDTMQHPGHNATGIYQAGYLKEGVQWLQKLVPGIDRLAVLSDASPTGRAKVKEIERLVRAGELPVKSIDVVVTDSYETWKSDALRLAGEVDAFFVLNHNTLRDAQGRTIDQLDAGAWYLRHIRKPDISHERQFVVEGVLCAVDDSGFKQGYEAVRVARRILEGGEHPGDIPVYAPQRGEFVVNLERANMLGLAGQVNASPLVEARVDRALALEPRD